MSRAAEEGEWAVKKNGASYDCSCFSGQALPEMNIEQPPPPPSQQNPGLPVDVRIGLRTLLCAVIYYIYITYIHIIYIWFLHLYYNFSFLFITFLRCCLRCSVHTHTSE